METVKTSKKRCYYLDAVRGIAVLSIIYIHTVFFSGSSYVPDIVRHMSLLIDVPLFFFLAGWGFAYSNSFKKAIHRDLKIQLQYSYYILVVALIMYIFGSEELSLDHIGHWLVYTNTKIDILTSTISSSWFLRVYMPVTVVGTLMLTKLKRSSILLALAIIPFLWLRSFYHPTAFLANQSFWFYLIIYILGYLSKDFHFKKFWHMVVVNLSVVAILATIKFVFLLPIFNIQDAKFPPNLVYLLWSSLFIMVVLYFKQFNLFKKKHVLVIIGQNAIWFFFAQGISSSLLYYLRDFIDIHWLPKLIILYIINVTFAIIITIILKHSYRGITWFIKKLYERFKKSSSKTSLAEQKTLGSVSK